MLGPSNQLLMIFARENKLNYEALYNKLLYLVYCVRIVIRLFLNFQIERDEWITQVGELIIQNSSVKIKQAKHIVAHVQNLSTIIISLVALTVLSV